MGAFAEETGAFGVAEGEAPESPFAGGGVCAQLCLEATRHVVGFAACGDSGSDGSLQNREEEHSLQWVLEQEQSP